MEHLIQIDGDVREATAEETAQINAIQAQHKEKTKIDAERQALKIETLEKLGLTVEEVNALFS